MCFPSRHEVDAAWSGVAGALAAGKLGPTAKVASRSPGSPTQVLRRAMPPLRLSLQQFKHTACSTCTALSSLYDLTVLMCLPAAVRSNLDATNVVHRTMTPELQVKALDVWYSILPRVQL